MKNIDIIGGGTVSYVRNHLALTAPAYGNTARFIYDAINLNNKFNYNVNLHLTKMANAGQGKLETSQDIDSLISNLIENPDTKIIFFNPALVDFDGSVAPEPEWNIDWDTDSPSGKYETRLKTSEGNKLLVLSPASKIISKIRRNRKDIFLVGFKTTCGATEDEQFIAGLNLLKTSSCNLVLANDTKTRVNMIITPEQARYSVSSNRNDVLNDLVQMTLQRSMGTFTKSTVIDGQPIDWNSKEVPNSLREVVNFCISQGAYKPFNGSTVGHFASKVDDKTFLTSRRKTNFNNLKEVGLVKVESKDLNSVIAYGSKPSVGGMSQRIIFKEHPEMDCIVHFHCQPRDKNKLSVRPQDNECGSHECGKNTSAGLRLETDGIKCVYLDKHGPNIVFNQNIDPNKVIKFIDDNFDLKSSTDEINRSDL